MSVDIDQDARELLDLTGETLRGLVRQDGNALDIALSRMLDEDDVTTEVSAGFQSRI
ncbi:hypothetical protein [Actinomadura sp. DC4]|uniref:hypothetical protein n=1 Tax=Actinomadura sp. DC4 TaxID=3055069 RepID=UPI0025B07DAC|nr:hypothetical protein [Actinomadura sp. DC4]MDN3354132.1 hypothetical protein [Actinomadura sp. DC4]